MTTYPSKEPIDRGGPEDWDPRLPWPAQRIERELRRLVPDLDVYTHWIKVFSGQRIRSTNEDPDDPNYFNGDAYEHLYDAGLFPMRASVDVEISYGGGPVDIFYEKTLWENINQDVHDPEIRGHYAPMVLEALKRLKKQVRKSVRRVENVDLAIDVVERAIRENKKAGYKPA